MASWLQQNMFRSFMYIFFTHSFRVVWDATSELLNLGIYSLHTAFGSSEMPLPNCWTWGLEWDRQVPRHLAVIQWVQSCICEMILYPWDSHQALESSYFGRLGVWSSLSHFWNSRQRRRVWEWLGWTIYIGLIWFSVKAWNLVSTPYTDARYVRIMHYYVFDFHT